MERQLIEEFVATGQIRFEYRHFIVIDGNVGGEESRRAAEASMCAAEQGEFWNYHTIVFANWDGEGKGAFSNRRLQAFAENIELDMDQFNACFEGRATREAVQADEALARSLGISSTPTLLVNGQRVANPLDYAAIRSLILTALGQ